MLRARRKCLHHPYRIAMIDIIGKSRGKCITELDVSDIKHTIRQHIINLGHIKIKFIFQAFYNKKTDRYEDKVVYYNSQADIMDWL